MPTVDSASADSAKAEQALHLRRELAGLLPELRAYARFLVRDPAGSDDLVQDTVVRALASLQQFQAGTSLKAWLFHNSAQRLL